MMIEHRMRVIGGGALIAVAFYMSGLLVIFTPLPLLYVSVARGCRDAVWSVSLAVAAIAAMYVLFFSSMAVRVASGGIYLPIPWLSLSDFVPAHLLKFFGVGYFVFFSAIALVLGEGSRRRWGLVRWGGTAILAGLAVLAIVSMLAGVGGVMSAYQGGERYLSHAVAEMIKIKRVAGAEGAGLFFLQEHGAEAVSFLVRIIPSLVFVFTLLAVVLNFLIGRRLIRGRHSFAHVHNVARFRLPDSTVWGLIGSGLAFFFGRYIFHAGWMVVLAINCLIGILSLYFFQGMAVAVYFIQGIRFPLARTFAYVAIILFFQTAGLALVGIGVADVWVNFRARLWHRRHE